MTTNLQQMPPLLEVRGLTKMFPATIALSEVDFSLRAGDVHVLVGENGAGKSTLIKLITGVHRKDGGTILLEGKEIDPRSPRHAQELGISTVYQEVNLIPTLSVAENIFLGRQPMRWGMINMRAVERQAKQLLQDFNVDIDVTRNLSSYSVAIQQIVAIVRGVSLSVKVLILDEPTSSLDHQEVEMLFSVIRSLQERGIGIILITHFLDQVYAIANRVTVLRNGKKINEHLISELPRVQLITEMLGKELTQDTHSRDDTSTSKNTNRVPFLKVNGFARKGTIEPFDLEIRQGEIVGLAGLLGSGRTEVAHLIFGIKQNDSGEAYVHGKPTTIKSPRQAIRHGFGLCPEDRKVEGIIGDLSVRENIILALQAKMGWFNYLSRQKQNELANDMIKALSIATPNAEKPVKELSGGNQQKVILARWLISNPDFLILDEPTRGIDVGAHAEIIQIIKRLADEGKAMLIISSELAEIVAYSDRVMILRDRKKVRELEGDDVNENTIMHAIAAD
ncbi:MAG: sugar ABC transporter ATP-binding protein [Anaerolineae bacterium]|jgi:simple sugar transport system ATP-binding protein|nr:sugar ABC transporter ATP-binding protein [Anaerolineae bacterium]